MPSAFEIKTLDLHIRVVPACQASKGQGQEGVEPLKVQRYQINSEGGYRRANRGETLIGIIRPGRRGCYPSRSCLLYTAVQAGFSHSLATSGRGGVKEKHWTPSFRKQIIIIMPEKKKMVVIGGSFAGRSVLNKLVPGLKGKAEVTLVDERDGTCFFIATPRAFVEPEMTERLMASFTSFLPKDVKFHRGR
ncbi:hypothetical protein BJ684DRAFT_17952, partial [Piptocephalis cylindrospora]